MYSLIPPFSCSLFSLFFHFPSYFPYIHSYISSYFLSFLSIRVCTGEGVRARDMFHVFSLGYPQTQNLRTFIPPLPPRWKAWNFCKSHGQFPLFFKSHSPCIREHIIPLSFIFLHYFLHFPFIFAALFSFFFMSFIFPHIVCIFLHIPHVFLHILHISSYLPEISSYFPHILPI